MFGATEKENHKYINHQIKNGILQRCAMLTQIICNRDISYEYAKSIYIFHIVTYIIHKLVDITIK